mgnify:CR=1 FL=1
MNVQTQLKELTLEVIKDNLQESYNLIYIDYRDNLDEQMDELQNSIINGNFYNFDDKINDWYYDSINDSINEEIHELKKALKTKGYSLDNFEDFEDVVYDIIYERDNSNPLPALINNTSKTPIFFSLNMYIDEDLDSIKRTLNKIKKILNIPFINKEYDKDILYLLNNRCYGGHLGIFALPDFEDLLENKPMKFEGDIQLAIVDYNNGSGWYTTLKNFETPYYIFNKNIFIDETFKYNFSFAVCDMSSDWCKDCELIIDKPKETDKIINIKPNERLVSFIKNDIEYDKIFKEGGCSFGDINIKRHRNVEYINEYPCGNRCKDCGTFWID